MLSKEHWNLQIRTRIQEIIWAESFPWLFLIFRHSISFTSIGSTFFVIKIHFSGVQYNDAFTSFCQAHSFTSFYQAHSFTSFCQPHTFTFFYQPHTFTTRPSTSHTHSRPSARHTHSHPSVRHPHSRPSASHTHSHPSVRPIHLRPSARRTHSWYSARNTPSRPSAQHTNSGAYILTSYCQAHIFMSFCQAHIFMSFCQAHTFTCTSFYQKTYERWLSTSTKENRRKKSNMQIIDFFPKALYGRIYLVDHWSTSASILYT